MASVVSEAGGRRLIQLSPSEHPSRPKLRLGKVTAREAQTARVHVEALLRNKRIGSGYPPATADWLAGVPVSLRRRLERFGLVGPQERRECLTVAGWVQRYIDTRQDVKAGTATIYGHTQRNLLTFFGGAKRLDEVTPGDADEFRIHLATVEGLAENTVRRRCRLAKQFFRAAWKKRLIDESPFADIKGGDRPNEKRFHFITPEESAAVLDACPDAQWRLIFALCRYGGLRCPTEVLRLTWGDVDWGRDRFTVHASKTEHHADGGVREVPIFPELAPHLQACFDQAEEGAEYVITRYRATNANLRTQLTRILKRAGICPWPKLFQNLRSTRETELTQRFPIHVVCKWIGNSQSVAAKFYLQLTDDHFAKAVQDPVQHTAATPRTASHSATAAIPKEPIGGAMRNSAAPCENREPQTVGPVGFEPTTNGL